MNEENDGLGFENFMKQFINNDDYEVVELKDENGQVWATTVQKKEECWVKEIFLYLKNGTQGIDPDELSEEEKAERELAISQHLPWIPRFEKENEKANALHNVSERKKWKGES